MTRPRRAARRGPLRLPRDEMFFVVDDAGRRLHVQRENGRVACGGRPRSDDVADQGTSPVSILVERRDARSGAKTWLCPSP